MHSTLKQFTNSGEQVTAAPATTTSTGLSKNTESGDCFDADLFELQLEASPSRKLRYRLAHHLSGVLSFDAVLKASRCRLLQLMLEQEERLARQEQEALANDDKNLEVAA